jgi:restriction endonuclease S subunit
MEMKSSTTRRPFPPVAVAPASQRLTMAIKNSELYSALWLRANIGQSDLRSVLVPLPSQPEQHAIAAILSDMDAEITALEAKLAKARQLKQGMMQELLTGRIRLV